MFGSRNNFYNNCFCAFSNNGNYDFQRGSNSGDRYYYTTNKTNQVIEFSISSVNVNGNQVFGKGDNLNGGKYPIVLFAVNTGGAISYGKNHLFRYFEIYDNNKLIRHMIPCYRKSDNEIGMYDTVNGVFYTNQGTGTFLKGANVN